MMCLFKKVDTFDESPPPATKSVRSVVFGKMRARNVAVQLLATDLPSSQPG